MAEKGKKKSRKERGLNVRVVQQSKETSRGSVHVNSYQKKTRKNRSQKNTSQKKTEASVTQKIKDTNKVKNTDKIESDKKPASFSRGISSQNEKINESEFETMKIARPDSTYQPKIITRDVALEKPLVKLPSKPVTTQPTPKIKVEMPEKPEVVRRTFQRMTTKSESAKRSAKAIKEQEIERAVKVATRLPETRGRRNQNLRFANFRWTRAVLAIACATTAIFAAVYFVNLTSTDMSLKVAAMQSGIEASYPSYVPRGYSLSDVTSASGRVTMHFVSGDDGFTIVEENSSWDSTALLNNYIKSEYGDNYSVVREQGLTLYMGDSWEAWVNGGTLYKLTVTSGTLTKKQLKTIAVSL